MERRIGLSVEIFVSKKKKHVHFAFKKALSSHSCPNELVFFVRKEWENRNIFSGQYKMCFLKLVHSAQWRFDYLFFQKKNLSTRLEYALEKSCNFFVDVSHKKFPRKYYLMRISQSKNVNVYMIVRKKRGRLLGVEKKHF